MKGGMEANLFCSSIATSQIDWPSSSHFICPSKEGAGITQRAWWGELRKRARAGFARPCFPPWVRWR